MRHSGTNDRTTRVGRTSGRNAAASRFIYVDRLVVAPPARERGYARHLYADPLGHVVDAGQMIRLRIAMRVEIRWDPTSTGSITAKPTRMPISLSPAGAIAAWA
jgi:hypothetical protein